MSPVDALFRHDKSLVLPSGDRFGAEILSLRSSSPPHGHDFCELAVILAGAGRHVTREGAVAVGRGDAVAVRACDWHGWEVDGRLTVANVYVDQMSLRGEISAAAHDPALRGLAWPVAATPAPTLVRLGARDLESVEAAVHALADRAAAGTAALGQLLVILGVITSALPAGADGGNDPAIMRAVAVLESQLDRGWTLEELAGVAGMSAGHLSRSFRRAFGAAPMQVLAGLRGERAAALLIAGDESVAAIGRAVGWADPNYFARRFKALQGVSPREYRARFRTG
ncbi:MAG TPA: AraC family transcriptional regulator [Mycobacteriales bacterium]|nr:AraC family transcriptional regulator [Mycobacteriales bacterium]